MSKLDRYVLRQVLLVSVLVAASLTAVAWLTQSMRLVDMVMNRGLSTSIFLWFTALLLPGFLGLVLPVALFTAVAFVYNKLALDSELVVMQSAGLSRLDLARPALVAATLAALIGYSISIFFQPASYRAFKDLEFEIRNNYASIMLQEGVFNEVSRGITVYIRKRSPSGALLGILVQDDRKPANPVTVMAERGAIVPGKHGPHVIMINGNRQERRDGNALSQLFFERYDFDLGALGNSPYARFRKPQERYLGELFLPADRADEIPGYYGLRMEGHDRLASPLLNFALPLIALVLLLGAEFSRRGQVVRVLWAICAVVGLEAAMLGIKSLGARYPDTAGLIYLCPLSVIAGALLWLWRGPIRTRRTSPRPVTAAA